MNDAHDVPVMDLDGSRVGHIIRLSVVLFGGIPAELTGRLHVVRHFHGGTEITLEGEYEATFTTTFEWEADSGAVVVRDYGPYQGS